MSRAYTYAHTCINVTCSFYLHNYTPARIAVDCVEYCQSLLSHSTVQQVGRRTGKKDNALFADGWN
jgi:hypothetical protein